MISEDVPVFVKVMSPIRWILLLSQIITVDAMYRSQSFEQLIQYKNKYVTSGTLWSYQISNLFSCALYCQNDNRCISFFYRDLLCSGYDQTKPNSSFLTLASGVEFYRISVDCDGGYTFNTETIVCYKVYNNNKTQATATQTCRDDGADLAVIDTADKLAVYARVPSSLCAGIFVPIYNKCYWLTASAAGWYQNEQVCINTGGAPAAFPDASTYRLVVNSAGINGSNASVWIGANDLNYDGAWKNYNGNDLNLYDFMFNFTAEGTENAKDALAIIPAENCIWRERDQFNDKFVMLCEKNMTAEYWIGGSDQKTEALWEWNNGMKMDLSYFFPGEPSGSTSKNCAAARFSLKSTRFVAADCSQMKSFICEKV